MRTLQATAIVSAFFVGTFLNAAPASAATELTLCNKSGAKIFIALVYYDEATKKWMLSAWQNRTPGQCKSVGKMHSGPTYYYAEKEGRKGHWPAQNAVEKTYCVPSGAVKRPMTGAACAQGERSLGFRAMSLSGAKYTFNFNN
ncbi:MAG: DUF1036 domain-containing protein [Bosea sp. (in: a-proteobacteria)]